MNPPQPFAKFAFLLSLSFFTLIVIPKSARAEKVVLVAGGGGNAASGPAKEGKLNHPFAVAFDKAGNMYIGEYSGQDIRKVDSAGVMTTIAGTGKVGFSGDGGPATRCQFNCIHDVVMGPDGNLYIADSFNKRVRKLDLNSGIITTVAGTGEGKVATGDGGPADKAALDGVASLWFDPAGKTLFLSGFSKSVRAIDVKTGIISTIPGVPGGRSIAIDSKGNLYVAGGQSLSVRTPDGKVRVLLDKTHSGGEALPLGDNPKHLGIDGKDHVWMCDEAHSLIREYFPESGKLVTIAGSGKPGSVGLDGPPAGLLLNRPHGIYFHAGEGVMYIADSWNDRVLKIVQ